MGSWIRVWLSKLSRLALHPPFPLKLCFQWILEALSPCIKWLQHEGNHSPLPSAKFKNVWSYNSSSVVFNYAQGHKGNDL
jgi:hypothetical protein